MSKNARDEFFRSYYKVNKNKIKGRQQAIKKILEQRRTTMNKGLEALWEFRLLIASYEDKWSKNTSDHFDKCADIIEKELKDQRKRLTIISEILVDISKGNYSNLKVAIKEIREALE